MSDHGWGGPGQGGDPDWNRPGYGQQPGYGDQYGQPVYGEPQYPSDQYGQYGQQPGGPYGGGGSANSGGSQKGVFIGLGAVVVAGLVVLVLAISGVFSGDSSSSGGPKEAAEKLLLASKNQNLSDVKAAVCSKDQDNSELSNIVGEDHATDYSVGEVTQKGDNAAAVKVTVTSDGKTSDATFPVIKENGSWKVCPSELSIIGSPTGGPTYSTPTPSYTYPSSTTPTYPSSSSSLSTGSFCASTVDAASTVKVFIGAITLSSIDLAQGCVYQGRVSRSELQSITGSDKIYSPTVSSGETGPTFTFTSVDGNTTLKVTVEKESDGKYYVTDVAES